VDIDVILAVSRMLLRVLVVVEVWGVWREDAVDGVESWESLDILLRALDLVDDDVEELLL
jgi:hypothetical protein